MSRPVRTGFDAANPGMPPAIDLRHYAPHPLASRDDDFREEEPADHDPRSWEQWCEDEQGYHGSDRR